MVSYPHPPTLPPVASKAKDYKSERPSEVQNELDELRNRGLAKVLNRHFTDTTKKLAKEKAAADAALADLERRRANTSEFVPSKGGELNPFDSLYVELQQKRAECRRKERETMLLYQRYVHKFGKSAKQTNVNTPTNAAAVAMEELSPATSTVTTPEAPPPPSPVPPRTALQPLDENVEEDGGDTSFHFPAFLRSKQVNNDNKKTEDPPIEPESKVTESEPEEEEDTRPEVEAKVDGPSNDPPEEEAADKEEDEAMNQATPRKQDPPADPPAVKFAQEIATPMMENISSNLSAVGEKIMGQGKALFSGKQEEAEESEKLEAAEESSSPVETTVKKASDRMEILSDTSDSNRPTLEVMAAVQASRPASNEDDDDADDRSIISGLTMNSHVTKQVMEEIEQEMNNFLNTETKAIQKMLDEEEEEATNGSITLNGSIVGDEVMHASMKAEAMAKEMQKILDEYKEETASTATGAEETTQTGAETVATTAGYPRKYQTSDPTKQWMVYYDEKFQREYYFEKNTNTTQWEPPDGGKSQVDPRMMTEGMTPVLKRSVSRRDIYRKKMRKRRMRRLAAFSLAAICVGGTVFYWQRQHAEKSYPEAMVYGWNHAGQIVGDAVDTSLYAIADTAENLKDRFEYTFTDRKEREEAAAAMAAEAEKARKAREQAEQERLRQEAERKAAEEKARKLQEQKEKEEAEAQRKREEAKKRQQERLLELERQREQELEAKRQREIQAKREKELQLQRERELQLKREKEEKEAQRRAEEEARKAAQLAAEKKAEEERKALRRPFLCNLPLAYIHPRCNRLAKLNPMYKETDVLHSFLQ
mmetsp:Transcript_99079/g.285872  ORF Transcript_99079/g.285872 Transcript_99079/m.285872 type:complete len:821 (+) Transcript_99079:191-2653(+)